MIPPLYGLLALALVALIVVVARAGVKFRAASSRGRGVRVYDVGADLALPSRHARSYQIALYLTMKSRPPERPASSR